MKLNILSLLCLVSLSALSQNQAAKIYETEIYKKRLEAFKTDKLQKGQIVLLGNSLTQGGDWKLYFPNQQPANRGIVGDNTDGIWARLDEIVEARPRKLFLLMGVNDISQDVANNYITNNIKKILRRVKTESPETNIYLQSLLPINNSFGRYKRLLNKEKQIKALNKRLRKLGRSEHVTFIDLYPLFLDKTGTLLNEAYTTDGLHLNEKGYAVWVEAIRSFMEE